MSDLITFLQYAAIAVAAALLIRRILEAKGKKNATAELSKKINEQAAIMNLDREKFLTILKENPSSFQTKELVEQFELIANTLPEEDKNQVLDILGQPSERGKIAYMKSVVE